MLFTQAFFFTGTKGQTVTLTPCQTREKSNVTHLFCFVPLNIYKSNNKLEFYQLYIKQIACFFLCKQFFHVNHSAYADARRQVKREAYNPVHSCFGLPKLTALIWKAIFKLGDKTKDRYDTAAASTLDSVTLTDLRIAAEPLQTGISVASCLNNHLVTGPVVAFSARPGTAGWPLQAHSSAPFVQD